MNLRFIDWIWHVRGSLALAPGQSGEDVFTRLDPLFHETGTTHERADGTLTFRKKDQPAQDKMSVFDHGVLVVEHGVAGAVLRYHLVSRALLFCFLLPLLFVGLGQLTLITAKDPKPPADAAKKAAAQKAPLPMNPLDKALGAPAPDDPKKAADKAKERKKKPSATTAYVFAGIFAALYLIGRILEAWLIKRLFRRRLLGA